MVFFVLISIDLSSSYRNGPLFCFFIFISLLLTDRIGVAILNNLGKARLKGHIIFKLASKNLTRFKTETLISLMILVLLSAMLTLIPQLNHIIVEELSSFSKGKSPHFFLIDIQKEQVEELKKFCEENKVQLEGLSPMVKAKIQTLNGKAFQQLSSKKKEGTREAERDSFYRNRPVNLSFKKSLYEDEKIIKGKSFEEKDLEGELPGISLEKRYAKRLNLKIGDELGLSILGMPLKGKVESFRSVNWANLKPNFFILFKKGILENYPQTLLATTFHDKDKFPYSFQMKLLDKFPNISSIDLKRSIQKTRSIFNDIILSFRAMTFVCLFVGIFVIWTIFQNQLEQRIPDYNLLKILGLSPDRLKQLGLTEIGLLISFSGTFGVLMGYLLSFVVISLFFDLSWSFYGPAFLSSLLSMGLVGFLVYQFIFKKVIEVKTPNELLKGF
jgi:putative ABC transport system permease protein